jgi:glycosyltransferase involved in cell wall biosynthesis
MREKLRLLVACDVYFPPSTMGGPMAARRWAHQLAARGHEVVVLAPSTSATGGWEQDGLTRVRRVASLPLPHPRREMRRQYRSLLLLPERAVRETVAQLRPHLVHSHFTGLLALAALREARRRGLPVLGTNHTLPENALFFYGRGLAEGVRRRCPGVYRLAEKAWARSVIGFYNRCDLMTAPTQAAIDLYRGWGLTAPAALISNGIDLGVYRNVDAEGLCAFRRRFTLPDEGVIVLYAGRLHPEKRVEVLLDAFALLVARGRPVHLLIAGGRDGPMEARIQRMGLAPRVTLTGFLHPERELPFAYRSAHVFASASECEGQGLVFLEGMATGLPVVAADRYAVRETVLDGQTGFLFTPGDHRELADRIETLVLDPELRARFAERARQHAATHDIERSHDQLEAVMYDLAGRRS